MLFRDYHIFVVPVEIDQSIIRYLHQDESEVVGKQRVRGDYRVLCKNPEIAKAHALEVFKYSQVEIVGEVRREQLNAVIMTETVESMSVEKVDESRNPQTPSS